MMDKMNSVSAVNKNVIRREPLASNRKTKASALSDSSEFGAQLMQAGAMAQAAGPQSKSEPKMDLLSGGTEERGGILSDGALNSKALGLAGTEAQSEGSDGRSSDPLQTKIDQKPLSTKMVSSMNTVASIAGLKPWSSEWVFGSEMARDLRSSGANALSMGEMGDSAVQIDSDLHLGGVSEEAGNLNSIKMEMSNNQQDVASFGTVQAGLEESTGAITWAQQNQSSALPGNLMIHGQGAMGSGGSKKGLGVGSATFSGAEFVNTLSAIRGGNDGLVKSKDGSLEKDLESGLNSSLRSLGDKEKKLGASELAEGSDQLRNFSEALQFQTQQAGGIQASARGATEVTGHVVKGAMAQDRLSSEALSGMSGGILGLSAQGGGEMRVRLRPDHLGELSIQVSTQGNQVGLKIQASSEESKRIIEESLSHLKESMANQRLDLGRVDLSVSHFSNGSSMGEGSRDHSNRNHQNPFDQQGGFGSAFGNPGDTASQNRSGWGRNLYQSPSASGEVDSIRRAAGLASISQPGLGRGSMSANASGRLDVRA